MPSVTQRQIAAELGVSVMTVSRALRNAPGLGELTRRKIEQAARRLDYRPNPYVQALMHARGKFATHRATLALVNPWYHLKTYRTHPANRRFFEGVRSRAHALGYGLDLFKLDAGKAKEAALVRILQARGIRGVVFHWFRDARASIDLDLTPFAAVTVGASLRHPSLNRVASDHFGNTRAALENLQRAGYFRVGLMLSDGLAERLAPVRAACALARQDERIETVSDLVLDSAFGPAEARQTVAWLKKHRPQAVLVHGGFFRDWLRGVRGAGIPPFAIVDLNLIADEAQPHDCGINQNHFAIGERCVEVVSGQLMQNSYGPPSAPTETLVLGHWEGTLPALPVPTRG